MAKLLKLRRGTTAQHSSFTGAEGEVTVDTTKDTLVVHDGSTAGGTPLAKEGGTVATATEATNVTAVANNSADETVYPTFVDGTTGTQGIETDSGFTYNPSSGKLTATEFVGNIDAVDGDFDGTLEADAYTVDGTALNEYIADTVGAMVGSNTETGIAVTYDDADNTLDFVVGTLNQSTTGNAATATALETARNIGGVSFDGTANINLPGVNAAGTQDTSGTAEHVKIVDNESTNEDNLIPFVEDAQGAGDRGLESDGDFHYNPSTGTVTATAFAGNLTGNVTGNTSGSAGSCTGNAATATTSGHVTVTDNESTNENNLVAFVEDAQSSTGSHGLEMDGNFTYNPSSGTVTATAFAGALTGNVTGNASGTAATVTGAAQSAITSVGTLTGLTVAGDVTFDNGTNDGKDITWDESADHLVFADDVYAKFGTGGDLQIHHNATDTYIHNTTGDLYLRTAGDDVIIQAADDIFIKPQGGESGIEVIGDGAVSLYHNDAAKLATSATGVTVTGTLAATAVTGDGSGLTGVGGGPPAGSVIWFADDSPPTGWLECDGSAVSRSTYSDLFAVISTTWGAGDGSSTFNLPDLRGEFIRGWDNSKGTDSGRSFASSQAGANKEHNHDASVDSQGAHSHSVYLHHDNNQWPGNYYASRKYAPNHDETGSTSSNGAHTHTVTVDNEGNAAGPYPRNFALLPIIKT